MNTWRNWFGGRRGGFFFLLLGLGIVGVFIALELRFPAAAQLQAVTGRVDWTYDSRDAMYFAARTTPQQFAVHVKSDADGRLRAALRAATRLYPVTVRFAPDQVNHPGFLPGDFHVVYGVSVGGKEVTSLDDVRASYRRDNLVALVLGAAFMLLGVQRLVIYRNEKPNAGRAGGGTRASRRSR
ncbi:hypothetical protein ASF61_08470 [Duganella sp. Leaf126]|uniref:hypothetical protein n=1 Tax=Duganella sp. Leaf126 TaxID=1736266 RepID=UPI0006F33965|nr:hypothetical protein [Duganella sp. Leaf126]KQQ36213.1 hypothetical protein ASF61_08470 [Duganella sp. Leaf126]